MRMLPTPLRTRSGNGSNPGENPSNLSLRSLANLFAAAFGKASALSDDGGETLERRSATAETTALCPSGATG
jgi:hypothetical protein